MCKIPFNECIGKALIQVKSLAEEVQMHMACWKRLVVEQHGIQIGYYIIG